ncbi:hypothetical protein MTO96_027422, partial [Rhipicephalus appendiculatus]
MAFGFARGLSTSLVLATLLTVSFVPAIGGESWSASSPGAAAPYSGSSEEDDPVLQSQEEDTLQDILRFNPILHGDSRVYDLM